MTSPFQGLLDNATITFSRPTTFVKDPNTGNMVPGTTETVVVRAYFKKLKPIKDREAQLDQDIYEVTGFAVDPQIPPSWISPGLVDQACTIDRIGEGLFNFEPRIHSAQPLVEAVTGIYLQGTFRIVGAGA